MRIGFGYDSHRFEVRASGPSGSASPQRLGGVIIPECPKLKGHSDAEVLIHAVIDALLGAVALGDIGSHFPDADPRW
jgi:2-C-methyl-D-erythritol 2,4-cyclodiphosphate synthase